MSREAYELDHLVNEKIGKISTIDVLISAILLGVLFLMKLYVAHPYASLLTVLSHMEVTLLVAALLSFHFLTTVVRVAERKRMFSALFVWFYMAAALALTVLLGLFDAGVEFTLGLLCASGACAAIVTGFNVSMSPMLCISIFFLSVGTLGIEMRNDSIHLGWYFSVVFLSVGVVVVTASLMAVVQAMKYAFQKLYYPVRSCNY